MRRAAGAAGALAVGVVMMSAAPAVAAPAVHTVEDVTGDVLVCGSTTYTITSGTIKFTSHEGVSASGNENFTGTITPQKVVATDGEGNVYSLRGAFWFGAAVNAQQETVVSTSTAKLQVVSQGTGSVDSLNLTTHVTLVNGNVKDFDFGTCVEPA